MKGFNMTQWLPVALFLLLANSASALVISPNGVSGLEVQGYGVYDLNIGDGVYTETYADHANWDATYAAEANAVSAALLGAILAEGNIGANYFDGCTHFEVCILYVPDTYYTDIQNGEVVHHIDDIGAIGMGGPYSSTGWISSLATTGIRDSLYTTFSSDPSTSLVSFHKVPEPDSLALLSLSLAGLLVTRRKRT